MAAVSPQSAAKPKAGRPVTDTGRAQAAKERALAGLRLMQLREKRRELAVVDAGMAAVLAVIRDRGLAGSAVLRSW
jgi:hypothetical protein